MGQARDDGAAHRAHPTRRHGNASGAPPAPEPGALTRQARPSVEWPPNPGRGLGTRLTPALPFCGRRPRPLRAGDECLLARRQARQVLYCMSAPCQSNRVCRFRGRPFPRVKARTYFGPGARSLSGSSAFHRFRVERNNHTGCGATQHRCKTVEALPVRDGELSLRLENRLTPGDAA
jgi:hypothetical protein